MLHQSMDRTISQACILISLTMIEDVNPKIIDSLVLANPIFSIAWTFCFDISQDFDVWESSREGEDRQPQTKQARSTLGFTNNQLKYIF